MTKKRRPKRLTKEQREAVHKPIETNLGMGWVSKYGRPADPREYEEGKPSDDYDPWRDM